MTKDILLNICQMLLKTNTRYYSKQVLKQVNVKDKSKLPVFQYTSKNSHNKRAYVWGLANTGALGILQKDTYENTKYLIQRPRRLSFAEKYQVNDVACGFGFTLFSVDSKDDVKIYGAGINTDSQLGFHLAKNNKPLELLFYPLPLKIPNPTGVDIKVLKLSAGRAHSLILTDQGLFTLGHNAYGQCGRDIIENEKYTASNVIHHILHIDGLKIIDIQCGQDHSLVITEDHSVYACGWGADGQTGLGHYNNCSRFTKVIGDIQGEKITKLSCSADCVLAISDKNEIFGWGNSEYGQLQVKNNEQQVNVATHLSFCSSVGKVIDIASGGSFCMALNDEGQLYVWGYGLLGKGVEYNYQNPWLIPSVLFGCNDFQPDTKVTKIACGISHLAAITNVGDLFMWGKNKDGCLGLGHLENQCIPLKVAVGASVLKISCGLDHSVAICQPFV